MPKVMDEFNGGARIATAGLIAALLVAGAGPASAGPFNWFKGKNHSQDQYEQPQQAPQSGGNGGGLFGGLFGGGGGAAQSHDSHRSELAVGDPEVAMIVNPALGSPTLSQPQHRGRPRLPSRNTRRSSPKAAGPPYRPRR